MSESLSQVIIFKALGSCIIKRLAFMTLVNHFQLNTFDEYLFYSSSA